MTGLSDPAGPLLGAPLGALAYQLVRGEDPGLLDPGPAPAPEA